MRLVVPPILLGVVVFIKSENYHYIKGNDISEPNGTHEMKIKVTRYC